MRCKYTPVIQKHGRWYAAWIEEVPGANTQGRTIAEARRNLREVLRMILKVNREIARGLGRNERKKG